MTAWARTPFAHRVLAAVLLAARPHACTVAAAAANEQQRSIVEGRLIADGSLQEVRVVLNRGEYSAIPRQDGSFVIHSLPPGGYHLEVYDTRRTWPTVRVDVSAKTLGKMRALMTHNRLPLPFPVEIKPLVANPIFFEKREGFKISAILMNPMALMMGVTLIIMLVMPKMMANMDPEQLKEMQQMQGGLADMLNPEKLKEKQQQLENRAKSRE
jgi:hypothetical protein